MRTTTTRSATGRHGHPDLAHHHPRVSRTAAGAWTWRCDCGGAADRTVLVGLDWRRAVIGALVHSASIAP